MARAKNSSFVGSLQTRVDVDAPTYKAVLRNAQAELAHLYDQLTGLNGEANTINHSGAGRGCLLGVPLWNCYIGRNVRMTSPTGSGGGKQAATGLTFYAAQPVFIPTGETTLDVMLHASQSFNLVRPEIWVCTSAGVLVDKKPLTPRNAQNDSSSSEQSFSCRLQVTSGLRLVFLVGNNDAAYTNDCFLWSYSGYFWRERGQLVGNRLASGLANVVTLHTPAGSTPNVGFTDFDDNQFNVSHAITAYHTMSISRNLWSLMEFVTGAPAGGNSSFTVAEAKNSVNPATSNFHAGTRAGTQLTGTEPEFQFPVFSECYGAVMADGYSTADVTTTNPPTKGMLDWYAPVPLSVGPSDFAMGQLAFPDFDTGSSKLKWAILAATEQTADVTNWSARFYAAGAYATSAFGAAFAVNGSGTNFSLATGTAKSFTPDAIQDTIVGFQRSGIFDANRNELHILGACAYFEP